MSLIDIVANPIVVVIASATPGAWRRQSWDETELGKLARAEHGYCVFHSPFVKEKQEYFIESLLVLLTDRDENELVNSYDLRGFIFPDINFRRILKGGIFKKTVNFQAAQFVGRTSFLKCEFLGEADFSDSRFSNTITFNHCSFSKRVKFIHNQFERRTHFEGVTFAKRAIFHGCVFSMKVDFRDARFSEEAIFQANKCYGDGDFRFCVFLSAANFADTNFSQRAEFIGAQFSNEIIFRSAQVAFIKNPPPSRVVLDGADWSRRISGITLGWRPGLFVTRSCFH